MPVADLVEAVAEWKKTTPGYRLYRDYYNGNHRYPFATEKFKQLYLWVLESARENLCPAVVSAYTDRLSVESWGDQIAADESTEQGMSRLLNMVNREAFRSGDAFTLTWNGKDGTPKARYHAADQIVPRVSELDPDQLDWAARPWADARTGHGRVNLYYGDRVERFITKAPLIKNQSGGVSPAAFPDSPTAWKEYDDSDDEYGGKSTISHDFDGVPVCWWKRDADDQGSRGRSVLTDVIPVQDELNKFVADMIVASERIAMPIRYALNMLTEEASRIGADGTPQKTSTRFDPTKQNILTLPGAGPAGEFPGPDADKLIAMQDHAAQKIGRIVGVPSYYFSQTSGEVPSGESLRVLTSRLISSVTDFQQDSSPVWRGQMQLLGITDPSMVWADPMPMDEAERVEVAKIKSDLGYSFADVVAAIGEGDADDIVNRHTDSRVGDGNRPFES